jgi:hypothetical protein
MNKISSINAIGNMIKKVSKLNIHPCHKMAIIIYAEFRSSNELG